MAIQSSVNALMQQLYTIGAISAGLKQQKNQAKEAQIQTDIAAGNAPLTEDGKVDTEWVQKRRDEYENKRNKKKFDNDNGLTEYGKLWARLTDKRVKRGDRLDSYNTEFYNDSRVQEYLKSFAPKSELKNEVAGKVARASVEARTDSIKQAKSNFDEHVASLIRYYGKGSENP